MRFCLLTAAIIGFSLCLSDASWAQPRFANRSAQGKPVRAVSYRQAGAVLPAAASASCDCGAPLAEAGPACGACGHCDACGCCCRPLIPALLDGIGQAVHGLLVCVDQALCGRCGCGPASCGCAAAGACGWEGQDCGSGHMHQGGVIEEEGGQLRPGPTPAVEGWEAPPEPPKDARRGPAWRAPSAPAYRTTGEPAPGRAAALPQGGVRRATTGGGDVSWAGHFQDSGSRAASGSTVLRASGDARAEFRIPRNPLRE